MPDSIAVTSGSHLNLVTTYQVDDLGRVTEETDPDHDATFVVYDDVDQEVRIYSGFIDNGDGTYSEESDGLPPTEVIDSNLPRATPKRSPCRPRPPWPPTVLPRARKRSPTCKACRARS